MPDIDRRLSVAIVAAALSLTPACGQKQAAPAAAGGVEQPRIKIGIISVTATYVPLYLAIDDGLFGKEGLQVDLLPFRGGSDLINAVVAGAEEVGVVTRAEERSDI